METSPQGLKQGLKPLTQCRELALKVKQCLGPATSRFLAPKNLQGLKPPVAKLLFLILFLLGSTACQKDKNNQNSTNSQAQQNSYAPAQQDSDVSTQNSNEGYAPIGNLPVTAPPSLQLTNELQLRPSTKQAALTTQHLTLDVPTKTLSLKQALVVGQDIRAFVLPEAEGGRGRYVYSIHPALPLGLKFNSATRELSGRPLRAQALRVYTYKVQSADEVSDDTQSTALRWNLKLAVERDTPPQFVGTSSCSPSTPVLSEAALSSTAAQHSENLQKLVVNTAIQNTVVDSEVSGALTHMGAVELPLACRGNGELKYSLSPRLPRGLNFDPLTRRITGTPERDFRRTTYTYKVIDSDPNKEEADARVMTFELKVNLDAAPIFSSTVPALTLVQGLVMQDVVLPSATGGNAQLVYHLQKLGAFGVGHSQLPSGLSFDPLTRTLSGTPLAVQEATTYIYSVTDPDGHADSHDSQTQSLTITVEEDVAPRFPPRPPNMPNVKFVFEQGQAIEAIEFGLATGGNGKLTYNIKGPDATPAHPDLPNGLSFDTATRTLRGTPTVAQEATTYTYQVTDSDTNSTDEDADTRQFVIEIQASSRTARPSFENVLPPVKLIADQTMSPLVLPQAQGTGALTYSIEPELPDDLGLNFDASTRTLSGTPQLSSTQTRDSMRRSLHLAYKATDVNGAVAYLDLDIVITAPTAVPPEDESLRDLNLPPVESQRYTRSGGRIRLPEATGGTPPYTYTLKQFDVDHIENFFYGHSGEFVSAEKMAENFSFNANFKSLTVNPDIVGFTYSFQYTVTDANQRSVSQSFWLQPAYLRDEIGAVALATDCSQADQFIQVDLTSGLTFDVHPSASGIYPLIEQAAGVWNRALSATALRLRNTVPEVSIRAHDGVSTISNGGLSRISGMWAAFALNEANPLNLWQWRASEIVFNPSFYPRYLALHQSGQSQPALNVMIHEMGHSLGLGHSTDSNHIMYYALGSQRGLHPDEVSLVRCLYGRSEPTSLLLSQFAQPPAAPQSVGVAAGVGARHSKLGVRSPATGTAAAPTARAPTSASVPTANTPTGIGGWTYNPTTGRHTCGWRPRSSQ